MKFEDRQQIFENLVREEREILLNTKGREYAGREKDADALANFKDVGQEIGGTKYQVLWIFLNKHLRSLRNAIKANAEHPSARSEESLESRIIDARNYLYLMYEMLQEDSNPLMTAHLDGYTRSYRFINETNAAVPPEEERHEPLGGGCLCEGCRAIRYGLIRDGLRPLDDAAKAYTEAMRQEQEVIKAAERRTFSTSEEILKSKKENS